MAWMLLPGPAETPELAGSGSVNGSRRAAERVPQKGIYYESYGNYDPRYDTFDFHDHHVDEHHGKLSGACHMCAFEYTTPPSSEWG